MASGTAFKLEVFTAALRAIALHRPPSSLSSVSRIYRGDMEMIVVRALEKDKARRYASAADPAAQIHRYLGDQSIVARPRAADGE